MKNNRKAIIIYQCKYGATAQYAHWLAAALQFQVLRAADATPAILESYDLVILGSSVYVGNLTIRKWLKQHNAQLLKKQLLLFIVCGTTADDRQEQQKLIDNNLTPDIRRITQVFFLGGRCVISKLSWMDRLLLKVGAMLAKEPNQKAAMNRGFDRMNQSSLEPLIAAARSLNF